MASLLYIIIKKMCILELFLIATCAYCSKSSNEQNTLKMAQIAIDFCDTQRAHALYLELSQTTNDSDVKNECRVKIETCEQIEFYTSLFDSLRHASLYDLAEKVLNIITTLNPNCIDSATIIKLPEEISISRTSSASQDTLLYQQKVRALRIPEIRIPSID